MRRKLVHALALLVASSAVASVGLSACASAPPPQPAHGAPAREDAPSREDALARVAAIHGGAGPWAVAGYRMGSAALAKLGLHAQSFDLEVIHHTPGEVQYSCIADGAAAATGASVGKLNLRLVDAAAADVATTYRNKATGKSVTLRPTAAFAARFRDVPRARLLDAGREVLALPDAEVFEEVAPPAE